MSKKYKFRISYLVQEKEEEEPRAIEFRYHTFREARQNYKAILLTSYRRRTLAWFRLCLNRTCDPSWSKPIFSEMVGVN